MPPHWPAASSPPRRPTGAEVFVWRVPLTPRADLLTEYRHLLDDDEIERADRFLYDDDRQDFIAARGALRILLARCLGRAPGDLRFAYGDHGKPELTDAPSLSFNLSHSGDWALIAMADAVLVGVDVEQIRPLPDALELAERFFSDQEVERVRELPESAIPAGFFNAWTRKEAFVKAVGTGLSLPLHTFDVTLVPDEPARLLDLRAPDWTGTDWTLRALYPSDGYAAALAVAHAAPQVSCFHWSHAPSS